MQLRQPILIHIEKNRVVAKELHSSPIHDDDCYIWTKSTSKGEVVQWVGSEYNSTESEIIKHKVFYGNPNMIIDDAGKAAASLRFLMQKVASNKASLLIKPVLILNVPYPLEKVEIDTLNQIANSAGAREVILLNEQSTPIDHLLKPNYKVPYKIVSGDDRFKGDEGVFVLILFLVGLLVLLIYGSFK